MFFISGCNSKIEEGVVKEISPSKNCRGIQTEIDTLPDAGGVVYLSEGEYICEKSIVINRNNVTLKGSGGATILKLKDNANVPVLIIGETIPIPTITRRNITISDLIIDGNRLEQSRECSLIGPCSGANALRNNGITLRKVENIIIERVTTHSTRSGGLVSELSCENVTIKDFTSYNNYFDGIAGYETKDSNFTNLALFNNCAAGVSLDINFSKNTMSNINIYIDSNISCSSTPSSGDVGMFIRDSHSNIFKNIKIHDMLNHGIFVAQVNEDISTGPKGNLFSTMILGNNAGFGIIFNDASATDNVLVSTIMTGNTSGCLSTAAVSQVVESGNTCN
jgi:hypothetical protein